MIERSGLNITERFLPQYRRAIVEHLVRQSGGPTPEPKDALRLAMNNYGLLPRQARVGRFTARICRIDSGQWALDFNPDLPKHQLVAAIWHELSELLCLSDDLLSFDELNIDIYRESAISPHDLRHICACGVERFVSRKLLSFPEVRAARKADIVRRLLIARAATVPGESLLPQIDRERWYDDDVYVDGLVFKV